MPAVYGYIRDNPRAIDMYRRAMTRTNRVDWIELLTRSRGHVRFLASLDELQASLAALEGRRDPLLAVSAARKSHQPPMSVQGARVASLLRQLSGTPSRVASRPSN